MRDLNILPVVTKSAPPMFDKKCVEDEDEAGTCLNEKSGFAAASFTKRGKRRIANKEAVTAKQNWLKAYRENKIQFVQYVFYTNQK